MSYAVLRGNPTASQLFLDSVLDAIIKDCRYGLKERDEVNLAEIIYYSLRKKPDEVFMVNGLSGKNISNAEILEFSIPVAQAIRVNHIKERNIMILMKNHQNMAVVFYATLFADVVPIMIDPDSTICEISHFMQIVHPCMVFCDTNRYNDVKEAATQNNGNINIKVISCDSQKLLKEFSGGYLQCDDNFQLSKASSESTVILIPTSGSSGLPKATILAHNGLIAQLPTIWSHYDHFPRPTERALLLSSAQWVTHTLLMLTCPVFGVTLIMTPQKPTTGHVLEIMEKYRPTWSLVSPIFLKTLAVSGSSEQLSSINTVIATGSPLTEDVVALVKEKFPATTHLGNGMGMTETHSFITMPAPGTAWQCNGSVLNSFVYKIVDENGHKLKAYQRGELYIKSRLCIFRGYYKNDEAWHEAVTPDGWYKTGDVFYYNERDEIYFVERKKFWFKYLNYQIAPEELESIICTIRDVKECVVCDSEKGPAAAVVTKTDNTIGVEKNIHIAINGTLSNYKRLRGGIYFVSSLPRTHSGKIKRMECSTLIQTLIKAENKYN